MNPIIILIISEILLSLYPVAVKHTKEKYETLAFIRILIFAVISIFFVNYIKIFSVIGVILGLLNFIHIQFVYKGYKELKEPISNTIFYTYPLFIAILGAIFFGQRITIIQILLLVVALIGVYLINYSTLPENKIYIIYILLASFIEALLLLILKFGKLTAIEFIATMYLWSLFFSYIKNRKKLEIKKLVNNRKLIPYIIFIIIVGFTGLYMRFYSVKKLNTFTFSHFSYLAVIFSSIIGVIVTKERITKHDIIGSIIIILTIILNNFRGTFIIQ